MFLQLRSARFNREAIGGLVRQTMAYLGQCVRQDRSSLHVKETIIAKPDTSFHALRKREQMTLGSYFRLPKMALYALMLAWFVPPHADAAIQWSPSNGPAVADINSLAIDPSTPATLYAGTSN
ncbi:MAG: hypothetical protein R8M38_08495, partial [Mariprofundaceae bacterium]